jgi:hypothetical protein
MTEVPITLALQKKIVLEMKPLREGGKGSVSNDFLDKLQDSFSSD